MSPVLADRGSWSLENCSIKNTLDLVGNKISLLLLREAFLGTTRFDDFAERVEVSEPAAARRLQELVDVGVFERTPYRPAGQRTRYEYHLTPKGRAFLPVMTALRDWGDDWASGPAGPPLHAVHRECGEPIRAELRCRDGHRIGRGEIELRSGSAPRR